MSKLKRGWRRDDSPRLRCAGRPSLRPTAERGMAFLSTRHCERSVAIPYLQSGSAYRGLPRRSSSQ